MELLDNIEKIGCIDSQNMLAFISNFPKQCEKILDLLKPLSIPDKHKNKKYKNILLSGMGGSAIGGHILTCYLREELKIPVILNREYTVPGFVNNDTLCIFSSYSGNTEETLNAYNQAKAKDASIISVSSDGKLISLSEADDNFYVRIPSGSPPRAALGYSFFSLLMLLVKLNLIQDRKDEIFQTVEVMKDLLKRKLGIEINSKNNLAKQIANKCYRKIPVIYAASDPLDGVVIRWRTQIAENSKALSFTHVFPELNHNEIVGWHFPEEFFKDFLVIFLKDKNQHIQVSKRIEITNQILQDNNIQTIQVESEGDSLLSGIFSLIYIGDFVSFYLSVLNGINPTPVDRIDYFKKQLSNM